MRNPREGWGLTNDGKSLIFSDGSASFFFADPQSFAIQREVKIKSDRPGAIDGLNELELVDGKLYGNIFLTIRSCASIRRAAASRRRRTWGCSGAR